jgi:acetyltransferase-like isoleucine patch superfamily enzyme
LKNILKLFFNFTKPFVRHFVKYYGIQVNEPCKAHGVNKLVVKGGRYACEHQIPNSVYFNTGSGGIVIGENCVFGENVSVLTGKHFSVEESEVTGEKLHYVPPNGRDIKIGVGCYIGGNAIIIGPVTIGNYVTISAGAVVTKSIPDRAFVAGVPAKVIRIM